MLKVAALSKWHVHADGYAHDFINTGKAEIAAVWDEEPARGKEWAEQLNAPFYSDLDELLALKEIDIVSCTTPTTCHLDVLSKAALAGKHIFTEKVMAPTVDECLKIADAVKKSGVKFAISLPYRFTPFIQLAKKLIADGEFGNISIIRVRNGHNGVSGGWLPKYWFDKSKAAGGALLDLGCHPMYQVPYILNEQPKRISSLMTEHYGTGLDESATVTIEYANKTVAIMETSFVTYDTPGSFEIYGDKATLLANGSDVKYKSVKTDGWIKPEMPAAMPIPINMFVDHLLDPSKPFADFGIEDGILLTKLMESAYISNSENRTVLL